MTRTISSELETAIDNRRVSLALFVEMEFSGDTLRLWTGYGEITWDGKTWLGAGDLLGMSEVRESQEVRANGVSFSLSGLSSSTVSLAYNQHFQGRKITAWLAHVAITDTEETAAVATPKNVRDRFTSYIRDRFGIAINTRN